MPCYLVITESREYWRVDEERALAMNWTVEQWDEQVPKDLHIEEIISLEEGERLSIFTANDVMVTTNSPIITIIELPRDHEYAEV